MKLEDDEESLHALKTLSEKGYSLDEITEAYKNAIIVNEMMRARQ